MRRGVSDGRRETRIRAARRDAPSPPDATAVLPLDVFGPGSTARAAFKFPPCCCETVNRVGVEGRERERQRKGLPSLRKDDTSRPTRRQEREDAPGMAQNVNPFSSMQNTPTKAAEEKQSLPKDNHAVSKRYESGQSRPSA